MPARLVLLAAVLVAVRLSVVGVHVLGPWTDEPAELAGWDAERFQEIVDHPGSPYLDHEVEYPPGALVALTVVAGRDVVSTQDRLVLAMLLADLAVALVLLLRWGRGAAMAWLVLGLAVLPGAYLRFDLLSVLLGVGGVALADGRRARLGGLAVAASVLVKTWPVVVVPSLLRAGRHRALTWAAAAGAIAGLVWVGWAGVDGPTQVVGFRGATGWHVESSPGLVAGLLSGDQAHLEAGAFRLGQASAAVSAVLAAAMVVAVALLWRRALDVPSPSPCEVDRRDALASAGAVAVLLATAPLLSPQYLVWLLPWAAVCWAKGERTVVGLVAGAAGLTAAVLAAFGPPGVDVTVAEVLLLLRNGLLVGVAVVAFRRLAPGSTRTTSGRVAAPRAAQRAAPRPTAATAAATGGPTGPWPPS